MSKTWKKWTKEEDELLKIHWKLSAMKELMKQFSTRTYQSLMKRAAFLKIKSEISRKRQGSLEFLNQLNPKSSYWWGFIIADGYLSKRGDLIINLNIKDKEHLLKLSNHLNCKISERKYINSYTNSESYSCNLAIADKKFANKWLKILEINSPKTYTPPNLSIFLNKENFIYFIIGLIDGDGCIWESKNWLNLRIELHLNWLNTLKLISSKLKEFYDIDCKINTTKKNTSKLEINTKKDLKILKSFINSVDFMERKWSKLSNL